MVSMYIESVSNRSSPPAILLRESFRDGGRVKKRTLANLSFRTLLADLGTLIANTMRVADSSDTFTMLTEPTPVQKRSFKLLGVTPRM